MRSGDGGWVVYVTGFKVVSACEAALPHATLKAHSRQVTHPHGSLTFRYFTPPGPTPTFQHNRMGWFGFLFFCIGFLSVFVWIPARLPVRLQAAREAAHGEASRERASEKRGGGTSGRSRLLCAGSMRRETVCAAGERLVTRVGMTARRRGRM